MQLILNGEKVRVGIDSNLIDVIEKFNLSQSSIVIEYNYKIINKKDWDKIVLGENDNIEILKFIGGG